MGRLDGEYIREVAALILTSPLNMHACSSPLTLTHHKTTNHTADEPTTNQNYEYINR